MSEAQHGRAQPQLVDPTIGIEIARQHIDALPIGDQSSAIQSLAFEAARSGVWNEFKETFGEERAQDVLNCISDVARPGAAWLFMEGGYESEAIAIAQNALDPEVGIKASHRIAVAYAEQGNYDAAMQMADQLDPEKKQVIVGLLFDGLERTRQREHSDRLRRTEYVDPARVYEAASMAALDQDPARFTDIIRHASYQFTRKERINSEGKDLLEAPIREMVAMVELSREDTDANKENNTGDELAPYLLPGTVCKWDSQTLHDIEDWVEAGKIDALILDENYEYALTRLWMQAIDTGSDASTLGDIVEAVGDYDWDTVMKITDTQPVDKAVLRVLFLLANREVKHEYLYDLADGLLAEDEDSAICTEIGNIVASLAGDGHWALALDIGGISKKIITGMVAEEVIQLAISNQEFDAIATIVGNDRELAYYAHTELDDKGHSAQADEIRPLFHEVIPALRHSEFLEARIAAIATVGKFAGARSGDWALALRILDELDANSPGHDGYEYLAVQSLRSIQEMRR